MALILSAAFLTFGCASPPEAEKKAAEEAVAGARAAGVEKYASADFVAITAALKEAESHMGAKKYGEAKTAYVRVKDLADKSAKGIEAGRAAMKAQVEQDMANAEKRWQEVEGKVRAAGKRLKADLKQTWEVDGRGAAEALQAAKGATATDPLAAKEKLSVFTALVEKWENELKKK